MRSHYWSESRLASYVRKIASITKPPYETSDGWDKWHSEYKMQHPYVYWFTEDFLDGLQNIVNWIPDRIDKVLIWYENVFVTKTHLIQTGLQIGEYHDVYDQVIYGLFTTLVDFIESEKAWLEFICNKDKYINDFKWYEKYPFSRFRKFQHPEMGIVYLKWEMRLVWEPEVASPEYVGLPTWQAISAKEQYQLYHWWKEVRPLRIDPYDDEYYEQLKSKYGEEYYKEIHRIEQEYRDEDERMMIRLIKILPGLWT